MYIYIYRERENFGDVTSIMSTHMRNLSQIMFLVPNVVCGIAGCAPILKKIKKNDFVMCALNSIRLFYT